MNYKGKIDHIDHIVISDPMYEKNIWCRYEKNDVNAKNWVVNLDIHPMEVEKDNYDVNCNEFSLLLKKEDKTCNIGENDTLIYSKDIKLNDYTIGMDSACVALGINDKAKEIIDSKEEWQPSCAIRTGGDGTFGTVFEGKKDDELQFLLIMGYIEDELMNQNELFDYLISQFEIKELVKEDFELESDSHILKNGDKVEVSSCSINNDVGGTTIIRNSRFKDEVDGMNLTIEYPDGKIEHTRIQSTDKLVQLPIEVEVLDKYYDYETGYRYKGKMINKDLIQEFNTFGTTGFKPEDYKKYKNKELYEDAKKASKKYNPEIVYFSEFDVVKVLEKVENKNDGIEI